jgi:hypothetical protein
MGSFFPELFGFALDGLILFSAITFVQLKIEEKRTLSNLKNLKNSLRSIAAYYIASCNLIANQHGRKSQEVIFFEHDHEAITKLCEYLSGIKILDSAESVKELVDYIRTHKSILESALPITAKISPQATHAWTSFLVQINIINSKTNNFGPSIFNSLEALRWLE